MLLTNPTAIQFVRYHFRFNYQITFELNYEINDSRDIGKLRVTHCIFTLSTLSNNLGTQQKYKKFFIRHLLKLGLIH